MNPVDIVSAPPERIHVLEVLGNAIVGGMENHVARLVERLPRERYAVTALCPCESALTERLRACGAEVLITPMPHDEAPWSSVQMACTLIRSSGVDVLHAHLPNAHLLAGLAGALADRPVLATIHGRQVTPLDLEVHQAAGTHISVVCRHSYFHALGIGVAEQRLSCIPNGVDTDEFQPGRDDGSGLRAGLGLAMDTPLVGFVGRLSPEKGPEVFVHTVQRLRALVPQAHGVMIGEGPMQAELLALIDGLGLAGQVHLAGVRDDMPCVYRTLDVVASTSHSEAMPLALMEAMASGLPIVATRVGGVPELLEQGGTGYGVGAGDVSGLAAQIARLLTHAGERARMGQRARQRTVERYALAGSVERTASLLTDLAARSRDSAKGLAALPGRRRQALKTA